MNEVLKCVIVDDEPPAIRLVETFIKRLPMLELVYTTTKPLEALAYAERNACDLMFLDIQMQDLTGIQLSKILRADIKVIFTTAYPEFAVESYELNAVDYLLKPFEFERFYEAVKKVKASGAKEQEQSPDYVFIKTDNRNSFEKVKIDRIQYIEGLKNYVAIHCEDRKVITYSTLKAVKESLPDPLFVQIHKSFIVALAHIDRTSTHAVFVGEADLPIGQSYKEAFFTKIKARQLS